MAKIEGLDELKRNLDIFEKEAKGNVVGAVFHGAVLIQNEAKSNHPYTDRTQALTNSIQAQPPEVKGTSIIGETIAGQEYAGHVEFGSRNSRPYPFLFPAMEKMSTVIQKGVGDVIKRIKWVE